MSNAAALLTLSHLRVENANAVSGPLTWGFPPPTAFTGFAHALQRRLDDVTLGGIGIVCHRFDPQVYQPPSPHLQIFRLMRHPYNAGWKAFKSEAAALIEEGRAHLDITLLIEIRTEHNEDARNTLADRIQTIIPTLRLAGGSIRAWRRIRVDSWKEWKEDQQNDFKKLRYQLLPGFALVQRDDLLTAHLATLRQERPEASPLEAFLDLLALHAEPKPGATDAACEWLHKRRKPGWLVPLSTGFAALSPLHEAGTVPGARDAVTPFRFVEGLTTIGQWLSPHRLHDLDQMLWHPETDEEKGLYLCHNAFPQYTEEESYDDE